MMRNLKGWAALALSAAMVVSMGACGTSDKTDSQASVDSNSSSTTGYDVSGVKKDEKIAKMLPSSVDRKSTRLNSSHKVQSRMPSSA